MQKWPVGKSAAYASCVSIDISYLGIYAEEGNIVIEWVLRAVAIGVVRLQKDKGKMWYEKMVEAA